MAQYKEAKVAQLGLTEIPAHIKLERYRYRLTVKTPEAKKQFDSGKQPFDKNKKTIQVNIAFDTAVAVVEIYLDDNADPDRRIALKHFNKSESKINIITLKSKVAQNSSTEKHVIQVNVEQGEEVGWILVKKEQTFDSLLKWVYKKVPTHAQLNIFRHANAHLSDLQDLNLNNKVKAGQIILITNKKNSPKLNEYKKLALEAEKIYQILCKDKNFDAIFFANNYELLMDFYSLSSQVAKAKLEYMKTVEGHKEEYCKPPSINIPYETTNAAAIYSDKAGKIFNEAETKRVETKLVNELKINLESLQKAHALETTNKTRLSNDKHFDKFKQAQYTHFQKIENLLAKDLTTLHKNEDYAKILKNLVKDTSGVRSAEFQGGLKLSVARMHAIGSATISLKVGSKIIFYLYAIESAGHIYRASQTGDTKYTFKVTAVESATLAGGFISGSAGAMAGGYFGGQIGIVLAPFTAGLSAPVLGVAGAVIGGVGAGIKGTFLFNEKSKKILEVCD